MKVSDKRREKFWKNGETLPLKHQGATLDASGFYVNSNGQKLTKNTKTAGKPRMLGINFQKLYVGVHHSVRSKIIEELHTILGAAFKTQFPAKIALNGSKILIHLHFHNSLSRHTPDLDNLSALFVKCGIDCLTSANNPNQMKASGYSHKLGIIPDDTIAFIPFVVVEFTEQDASKQRYLDFNLYEVESEFTMEGLIDKEMQMQQAVDALTEAMKLPAEELNKLNINICDHK